jgi:hypothetical protein
VPGMSGLPGVSGLPGGVGTCQGVSEVGVGGGVWTIGCGME